jgi:signal transduction histidine kinase
MERRGWKDAAAYTALLAAAWGIAVAAGWRFGAPLDNAAYDYVFRHTSPPAWNPESVLLAVDEVTLQAVPGGMQGIRRPLALSIQLLAKNPPKVVAVDVTLADPGIDTAADRELSNAFCATRNLVLCADLIDGGRRWEDPLPLFRQCAARVGHAHAQPDPNDFGTRAIPLVKRAGHDQKYALALEAFSLSHDQPILTSEPPETVQVGSTTIPVPQGELPRPGESESQAELRKESRLMRVRFMPPSRPGVPRVSMRQLLDHPETASVFAGKVVFVGVTAPTATVGDRLRTPADPLVQTTGVVIHAEAYETIAHGLFLTDVGETWVLFFSAAIVALAGVAFRYLAGWRAYAAGVGVLLLAQSMPYFSFSYQRVFPFAIPALAGWLGTLSAASYYHLVIRKRWLAEQAARTRYQQAMHFVTHEMRTPLSAIQGSSELISRYALTEEKRKQIALLINSESKRLARMVEIFLNVERLSAGQMELKQESICVNEMIDICLQRIAPLAERKHIAVQLLPIAQDLVITGDRELMEYACYNLLTNAVKYSPQRTEVTVSAAREGGHIQLAVQDQGIGMDQKEVKRIFQKFYRTRKAEESGEAGTGIGLSIVQQIVEQHGGTIEVLSRPGAGSRFTLVLPSAIDGRKHPVEMEDSSAVQHKPPASRARATGLQESSTPPGAGVHRPPADIAPATGPQRPARPSAPATGRD